LARSLGSTSSKRFELLRLHEFRLMTSAFQQLGDGGVREQVLER
jgi:hypothetical protein